MRSSSPWRKILFTPLPWLLVLAGVATQYLIIDEVAADVEGESWLGWVLTFAAAVPAVWAVVETIWLRFAAPALMVAFARVLTLPFLMGPILGVSGVLMRRKPGVEDAIVKSRRPDGWHYWFDASMTPREEWVLTIGANTISALILALLALVFIAMPCVAFWRPAEFAEANQLDTSPAHAADNAAAARAISIIAMMALGVPALVIWLSGDHGGAALLVALLAVPVGVALVKFVLRRQVPDHAARAHLPAWGRGIQTLQYEARQRELARERRTD